MNIIDIQAGQGKIDLEATIVEKSEPRSFEKFGKAGTVCNATLKDDTGRISLTLWNEQVDQVQVGSLVKITNGYASEYKGEKQLSTGKFGSLEVLETSSQPQEAQPTMQEP